ncbi:hypothetical protein ASPCAL14870 [Aspergillus calidoustus]|uniref:Uncharacterized protein n=1 Tax=Aspergillus calidoustus TaxID=454130 RepID=A0A0U5CKH2_ASPCI|nr:hypothetical protein ASPCAL14870 [Aspergillus calidoustus]
MVTSEREGRAPSFFSRIWFRAAEYCGTFGKLVGLAICQVAIPGEIEDLAYSKSTALLIQRPRSFEHTHVKREPKTVHSVCLQEAAYNHWESSQPQHNNKHYAE